MKFLKAEYDSIKTIIADLDLNHVDFSFVKKKGTVYIEHNSGVSFSYFRKKETTLNNNHQWEEKTFFLINNDKKTEIQTWGNLLILLKEWLTNIDGK